MAEQILITKSDGSTEAFSRDKLLASFHRAGADPSLAEAIVRHVERELTPGATTARIYRHAFALLRKHARVAASRYSLRRALLELGPSGFPFEDFIAEILRARGMNSRTRVIMRGACVEHEIDVAIEEDDGSLSVVEAKFHNERGIKSDVKVALYVGARVEDLRNGKERKIKNGWLVTNTKFTDRAIEYGTCAGLTLIGWDYPERGNLHDLIDEAGVFPLTALTTLSKTEKQALMLKGVVLCRDMEKRERELGEVGVTGSKLSAVLEESTLLCGPHKRVQ
jgi:hypothetical protein